MYPRMCVALCNSVIALLVLQRPMQYKVPDSQAVLKAPMYLSPLVCCDLASQLHAEESISYRLMQVPCHCFGVLYQGLVRTGTRLPLHTGGPQHAVLS